MQKAVWLAAALVAGWSAPALAQDAELNVCAAYPAAYRGRCTAVAQAAEAAQPRLAMLTAGGNPTLGTASTGGRGLFGFPRLSTTLRANLVLINFPDITVEYDGETAPPTQDRTVPALAVNGTAALAVTRGATVGPTMGGVGAVDLLASLSYIPFDLYARDVFKAGSAQFALGGGARLGLLRESATLPGVSVSVMYRHLGGVQVGNACHRLEEPEQPNAVPSSTRCRDAGEVGEAVVGASGLSVRTTAGKTLAGFGLTAGVGYDSWSDDNVQFAVSGEALGTSRRVYHSSAAVETSRWSVFANALRGFSRGSLVLEAGWMQGGERLPGFGTESDYDPEGGTLFGSLGLRMAI